MEISCLVLLLDKVTNTLIYIIIITNFHNILIILLYFYCKNNINRFLSKIEKLTFLPGKYTYKCKNMTIIILNNQINL